MGVICNSSYGKDFYSSCEPSTQSTCHELHRTLHCTVYYLTCKPTLFYITLHCSDQLNRTAVQCHITCCSDYTERKYEHCTAEEDLLLQGFPSKCNCFSDFYHNEKYYRERSELVKYLCLNL